MMLTLAEHHRVLAFKESYSHSGILRQYDRDAEERLRDARKYFRWSKTVSNRKLARALEHCMWCDLFNWAANSRLLSVSMRI